MWEEPRFGPLPEPTEAQLIENANRVARHLLDEIGRENMATQQVPSIGRIVHYVLDDGNNKGQHRPAIITRVWAEADEVQPHTACQLQVFTDGNGGEQNNDGLPNVIWKTSKSQGEGPGSWHWPEFVAPVETP